ncbi:hypothetical protein [Rhodopila sp.]|uniref:hypothetical protein n=1 Tax=Rhodopila sp. TaxID=2480087 RepID=UPI003D142272
MRHVLFSSLLPDGKQVCISPVSIDAYEASEAQALGDDTGYFIYEYDERQPASGIEILGKAASYEAAERLVDIFLKVKRPLASQE